MDANQNPLRSLIINLKLFKWIIITPLLKQLQSMHNMCFFLELTLFAKNALFSLSLLSLSLSRNAKLRFIVLWIKSKNTKSVDSVARSPAIYKCISSFCFSAEDDGVSVESGEPATRRFWQRRGQIFDKIFRRHRAPKLTSKRSLLRISRRERERERETRTAREREGGIDFCHETKLFLTNGRR